MAVWDKITTQYLQYQHCLYNIVWEVKLFDWWYAASGLQVQFNSLCVNQTHEGRQKCAHTQICSMWQCSHVLLQSLLQLYGVFLSLWRHTHTRWGNHRNRWRRCQLHLLLLHSLHSSRDPLCLSLSLPPFLFSSLLSFLAPYFPFTSPTSSRLLSPHFYSLFLSSFPLSYINQANPSFPRKGAFGSLYSTSNTSFNLTLVRVTKHRCYKIMKEKS